MDKITIISLAIFISIILIGGVALFAMKKPTFKHQTAIPGIIVPDIAATSTAEMQ